jgi:hypothetical protein
MPAVRLAGIETGRNDSLEVQLAVFNPNRQGVELGRTDYALFARGETLASGRRTEPVTLGARDSVELSLPLAIRLSRVLAMLPGALDETIECRFSGEYRARVLSGWRGGRFSDTMRFPVREQLRSLWDGLFDTKGRSD